MKRTTVLLPEALHARATRRARALGISLGELIRTAIAAALAPRRDPLFADDAAFDGPVPRDLAARHDRYLHDGPPGGDGPLTAAARRRGRRRGSGPTSRPRPRPRS